MLFCLGKHPSSRRQVDDGRWFGEPSIPDFFKERDCSIDDDDVGPHLDGDGGDRADVIPPFRRGLTVIWR